MTNPQNDKSKDPLGIADELLNELKKDEPSPAKAGTTDEKSDKELPGKNKAAEISKIADPLTEEVISLEADEVQEDNTDEFIIPASETSPLNEQGGDNSIIDNILQPQPEDKKIENSDSVSRHHDIALPPTREEKREGVRSTKVMAPDRDDSNDLALPPTREEKREGARKTKVMAPDRDDANDLALPPTYDEKREGARNTKVLSPGHDDSDDFIFAKYKKNSSHTGLNEASKKHKKRKKRFRDKPFWKKLLIILGWIFGIITGLILLLVIAFYISSCIGIKQLTNYEDVNITAPIIEGASINTSNNGKIQEYNGTTYKLNEDITTILCLGVDKQDLGIENEEVGTAGQADAIYLVAIDTKSGKTDIIAVPRDIVTDIGIYSTDGEYLRTEKAQLCLSYAYGDGFETSCENTKIAVERLFNNLRIQSYFAINMEAIAQLNDAVGGVTVTMKDDFFRSLDYGVQTRHYKGEVVTLYGNNAIRYVQQREVAQLESTAERMDRQINYLEAFSSKVLEMTKKDLGIPVDLYNIVDDNSVTDLNINKISALAELVISPGIKAPNFKKIPGELSSDGTYAIYNVDTQAFYEMFLDIFYIPQN